MTTKEKAHEIAIEVVKNKTSIVGLLGRNGIAMSEIEEAALMMAAWKEEQMTKNAIDFLVRTLSCTDGFIEEFKSAMKGE